MCHWCLCIAAIFEGALIILNVEHRPMSLFFASGKFGTFGGNQTSQLVITNLQCETCA